MKKLRTRGFLTPNEVANLLRVSPVTVRQWAQKGALRAELTPGGHRRFLVSDVEAFARARQQPRAAIRKILVVDDDPAFARYLAELLEGAPVNAATAIAYDGFQAGRLIHTFRPDVVLLDLRMPGVDGIQVCQQLKRERITAGVRIIAITGDTDDCQIQRVLAAGAECCLTKPVKPSELFAALGTDTRTALRRTSAV